MRLLARRDPTQTPVAGPHPLDGWMRMARWAALGLAVVLLALSLVPPALEAGAANAGADVNVTAEFYTAFDGGGGYLTWDLAPGAAARLRGAIDADADGRVSEAEFNVYQSRVDANLERNVLVLRNFEIAAVRLVEQGGLVGEAVDSAATAHLRFILNGRWAGMDSDIPLVGGGAVEAAFPQVAGTDRVQERTVILAAGASSFGSLDAAARTPRVPGGSVVVHGETYLWRDADAAGASPAVRFERFSLADSTLVLLVPLAVAYYLGVRRPRLEQEASGQRRIAPFHEAQGAAFLLILSAYFAGVPGLALWVAGVGFGVAGLWLAYRLYPVQEAQGERRSAPRRAVDRSLDAALAMLPEAHRPVGAPFGASAVGAWGPPKAHVSAALAMLPKAHAPVGARAAPLAAQAPEPAGADEWEPVEVLPPGPRPRPAVPPSPVRLPAPLVSPVPPVPQKRAPSPPRRSRPARPPAAVAKGAATPVRCPGCKKDFRATGKRPLAVQCPHCGVKGTLR